MTDQVPVSKISGDVVKGFCQTLGLRTQDVREITIRPGGIEVVCFRTNPEDKIFIANDNAAQVTWDIAVDWGVASDGETRGSASS